MTVTASSDIAARRTADVENLRGMAIRLLGRMYLPERRRFAFRLAKTANGERLEGVSVRYTATALIGLATEPAGIAEQMMGGAAAAEVCQSLLDADNELSELGAEALTLWAARALGLDGSKALARLRQLDPVAGSHPTVETAWCLSALAIESDSPGDAELAGQIADRLLASFSTRANLFPHWPVGAARPWTRAHVACFADLVYPIQALSHFHRATGRQDALAAARACAEQMCRRQGPQGQWWWHHDARTGRVVERYPVYSVHQDSMAPMALHALKAACGDDHADAIRLGLDWLNHAPEIGGSLIDTQRDVIWRKVARKEPNKLSRRVQAVISRVHPAMRAPIGWALRPGCVDWESRPYHMGWILHAWPAG